MGAMPHPSGNVLSMFGMDSFQNLLARTGHGMPNLMEATRYPLTRLTRDYQLMTSLYRNSWITRRIIDTIPKDMMKNGWKYESDITPEEIDKLHKLERKTRIMPNLRKGLNWGRLYGGAAGLMLIDGQEDELEEPLDLDAIMPGDFRGLLICDRWSGVYPMMELVDDPGDPEFGKPMYYEFRTQNNQAVGRVHHSRIIRFVGCDLPLWEEQAETYWGSSVMENIFEELKKRDNTSANIAGIVFQANLKVLQMEDMGELLAGTNQTSLKNLYNTIQMQNWLMNNFSMYIMSKEDKFDNIVSKFEGLDDIYQTFMMDISGAAQIPMTKLFGRSPAGMNATGESDLTNYYDVIEGEQEAHLVPALEKLLPVICMSALGYVPDDISVECNPIDTPNEKDSADIVKSKSDSVFGAHDRGIISDQVALMELKQMSQSTGIFTNITDELIAAASDEPVKLTMLETEEDTGNDS
jgi:phage-related protein (TIGR01555 family)